MYPEVFLPVSRQDMQDRGWWWYDFLVVTGDAYVDHPSFGPTVIARVLEAEGFRVAILAQPDWHSCEDFLAMGRPKLGVMIGAGNLDSMVAHYTAAKKRRSEDFYSPGKKMGLRPDRATIVYANRAREAFGPDMPIIIGGLEASLRRFAHYDYWDDKVRRSILFDAPADILTYGMGENATREIARRLKKKESPATMTDIKGTAVIVNDPAVCVYDHVDLPSYEEVVADKVAYANATRMEYEEHDAVRGRALIQSCAGKYLLVNPPQMPLSTAELDAVADLPYTREVHPMYDAMGGVPAIEEVRFSVIHNRGCIGGCNFCALAFHQGRMVTSRSHASVIREVTAMTKHPLWKGYVSDVGGPTANFRHPSCQKQLEHGMCPNRQCLAPTPCRNLDADESDYLALLRKLRGIPGVKKVFVRSGIRYDYMLCDKNGEFFSELVHYHVSGQLKVAPEHCVNSVLDYMGKPHIEVYEKFMDKYRRLNDRYDKEQYIVPYLMSSHPGSTLDDAVELAEYLHKRGRVPEQVQDFYPTPGTISTCMYYTEIDPWTMKPVYVAKTPHEKAMQRALLQWARPDKRKLVIQALHEAGREDLIGYGKECLVRPDRPQNPRTGKPQGKSDRSPAAKASGRPDKRDTRDRRDGRKSEPPRQGRSGARQNNDRKGGKRR
ncbi:MAG: YgiQ family radical SAM protein [Oscillospiraceae bacterium]|nr:YgiQ family radical SAM protein [Oscillospiraceae bacterium]